MNACVPAGREPFLPFGARSGWELLVILERYGCKISGWDVIKEEALITECLAFMRTERFKRAVSHGQC